MKWSNVVSLVHGSINLHGIPKAVLHCGGNDIGDLPCGALFHHMKFTITILSRMLQGYGQVFFLVVLGDIRTMTVQWKSHGNV